MTCGATLTYGERLEERANEAFAAISVFAAVVREVQDSELRKVSADLLKEGFDLFEGYGRQCAQLLLAALRSSSATVSHDSIFALLRLSRSGAAARSWILEAQGVEVVYETMVTHPEDEKLLHDGIWLVHALAGLRGLAHLLHLSRAQRAQNPQAHPLPQGASPGAGDIALRAGVAWALFELVKSDGDRQSGNSSPDASALVAVIAEVMGDPTTSVEGHWACCCAVDMMIKGDPGLGIVFLDRGGAQLLLHSLRLASGAAGDGANPGGSVNVFSEDLCRSVCYLVASLADGNAAGAAALRAAGALTMLRDVVVRSRGGGLEVEAAMWALGVIGGLGAVLDVMGTVGTARLDLLRGGLVALSECAFNVPGSADELARLPEALRLLLDFLGCEERSSSSPTDTARNCVAALGTVLAGLAPHAGPGTASEMDRGVEALLRPLQQAPPVGGELSVEAASSVEKAAEGLGRIAIASPAWRAALRRCGAVEALVAWIRSGAAPHRVQKFLCWAGVTISGLSFVARELRWHTTSTDVVDAGLCTIADILDDDLDGEYSIRNGDNDGDPAGILQLVAELMRSHSLEPEIQARGCHCVALLAPLVVPVSAPSAACSALLAATVAPVAAALRRWPRRLDVAGEALGALRALCLLCPLWKSYSDDGRALAIALRDEEVGACAELAVDKFADFAAEGAMRLLEDASATLALTQGAEVLLQRLQQACGVYTAVFREAGLKALFEVSCKHLQLLSGPAASVVAEACQQFANEDQQLQQQHLQHHRAPQGRLQELSALLFGLCGRAPAMVGV